MTFGVTIEELEIGTLFRLSGKGDIFVGGITKNHFATDQDGIFEKSNMSKSDFIVVYPLMGGQIQRNLKIQLFLKKDSVVYPENKL